MSDNLKCCLRCSKEFPSTNEFFHRDKKQKDGLFYYCKSCVKAYQEERRSRERSIEPTAKQCADCGITKTIDHFYRDALRNDGRENICKQCHAIRRGAEYREPPPPVPDGYKWCRHCAEIKPIREFHHKSSSPSGFREACIACRAKEEGFKYRKPPQEGFRRCARCQKELPSDTEHFYEDGRYPGMLSSWCRECTKESVSEWGQRNPDRVSATKKRWAERNPLKRRLASQRRLAREKSVLVKFDSDDWQRAVDYFKGRCAVCGRPPGLFHALVMDHWVPITATDCPGTVPQNIIPLCGGQNGCNNQKSNRPAAAWLRSRFGPRKAAAILKRINAYFASLTEPPDHEPSSANCG